MDDLINRQAAIDEAKKRHDFFRGATTPADKARRDELLEMTVWLSELPSTQPEVLACGSGKLVQESDGLVKDLVKDCISRQAAIVAVKDALLAWSSMPEWRDDKITEALVELPSAQPQRKKGKWLDGKGNVKIVGYGAYCSCCKRESEYVANYCPNCGADMRGEKE